MRAIVLAGGRGTRLRPLTDACPKPLLPFMGEPYLVGLLRRLQAVGCDHADVLVGPDAGPFDRLHAIGEQLGVTVGLVTEERPLDTAGATRRLLHGADDTDVLVCNGDVLTDVDYGALLAAHRDADAVATLALMEVEDTSSYGVIVTDDEGNVREFVEKPSPGTTEATTVNAGAYVIDAVAFTGFADDGPLSFEYDVFPSLLADLPLGSIRGVTLPATWQDLGTPERYRRGHALVLDGTCRWPWAPGLREVALGVAVDERAKVADSAQLRAPVVVGAGCVVHHDAVLEDVVLHDGATVGRGVELRSVIVGPDAAVAAGTPAPYGEVVV